MRTWPLTGRDEELQLITEALGGHRRDAANGGVLLAGPAGVGKTRLARAVLTAEGRRGTATRWAVGTTSAASVPLGALAGLLPVPAAGAEPSPLALLRQTTTALAEQARGSPTVLGVDDAHLLDAVSATLLHQLALERVMPLVVTLRSGEDVPDPIVALWKDGHLVRIDLQPLLRSEVGDLLATVLGGPVDDLSRERFWSLSQGNPLYLHELVVGALADGGLARQGAVWVWQGPLVPNVSLKELVRARVGTAGDDERAVLELLSLAEPLEVGLLTRLTSSAAVAAGERKELVRVEQESDRQQVRLTHPLYGEVVRASMPSLAARERRQALARALQSEPLHEHAELVRLATLSVDSGVAVDATLLVAAAAQASAALDHRLAERLATVAVAAGGGFAAAFVLADAVMYQERREADTVLALEALQQAAATDHEREIAAVHRAGLLFWGLGLVAEAEAVLREAEHSCHEDTSRLMLQAMRAYVELQAGRADEAIRIATPVLRSPTATDRQVLWPSAAVALACGLAGQTRDALAASDRGGEALRHLPDTGLDPYTPLMIHGRTLLGSSEGLALRLGGRVAEAQARAGELHAQAIAESRPLFAAAACLLHGQASLAAGQPATARRWLQQAVPLFAGLDPVGCLFQAHLALAEAWALSGDVDRATAARAAARATRRPCHAVYATQERLVDAWVTSAEGTTGRAAEIAGEAAAQASASGLWAMEALARHVQLRLGQADGVTTRLAELADQLDNELVEVWAAHAVALEAGDADQLAASAHRFAAGGSLLLATETYIQASAAYRAAGRLASATGVTARARALLSDCEDARTPITAQLDTPPDLSRREHEVAELASRGLPNREIATRLYLSVRTVESHLARVFTKLGINRRDQLAEALGHDEPG